MAHFYFDNVNDGFRGLVGYFDRGDKEKHGVPPGGSPAAGRVDSTHYCYVPDVVRRQTRNGPALAVDEPVTVTFASPLRRVLFNAARDANPFALLYEALWMLAGRNDVAPLAYYAKQFAAYSDDGVALNDAYGFRWRHARNPLGSYHGVPGLSSPSDVDQIDRLVSHLKADPDSRRAVLQMWDVPTDLLKAGGGDIPCPACRGETTVDGYSTREYACTMCGGSGRRPDPGSKAVCCNLCVKFRLRTTEEPLSREPCSDAVHVRTFLDATVFNRSNDLVWGMLGANYVTFTVLQEYMAARLGAGVGRYNVVTDDLHCYQGGDGTARWEPEKWLADRTPAYYEADARFHPDFGPAAGHDFGFVPLVRDQAAFERELPGFVDYYSGSGRAGLFTSPTWTEPFLETVAKPLFQAWECRKAAARLSGPAAALLAGASDWVEKVAADDWKTAAVSWLERRRK